MKRRQKTLSFRQQMRQSLKDLRSIVARKQSPSGDGRFAVTVVKVAPRQTRPRTRASDRSAQPREQAEVDP